ncbi:MAG: carboxypeptidase-like regulatory domain-containing protein [Prevotellaceae bacterium]|nr:carboxypeptidase-like regulatory domain-containing protein [Prevotellaceae bacterium]
MKTSLRESICAKQLKRAVLLLNVFLYSQLLYAQSVGVKGIVTDVAGEPLVGANVVEKGTTNGIVTDVDGSFSLNVSRGGALVISYVGYNSQEISGVDLVGGGGVNL